MIDAREAVASKCLRRADSMAVESIEEIIVGVGLGEMQRSLTKWKMVGEKKIKINNNKKRPLE